MDLITDIVGVAVGALLLIMAFYGVITLGGIALYVLRSWGLFTMAQRRGIQKAWMAWVPVLNLWVLGSLSDQYRYVVRHEIRGKRNWLLGLSIAGLVLGLVFSGLYTGGMVSLILRLPQIETWQDLVYMTQYQPVLVAAVGVSALAAAVNLLLMVLRWASMYDVYASSYPEKRVVYTVLSILLPVTAPFFLFACREKDGGMPPRRA